MAAAPVDGVSGDKVWSDRKQVEEGGKITAINIVKGDNFIEKLRIRCDSNVSDLFLFRYGDTWTPWRRCGPADASQEEMLELEPSSEEAISSVSGYSWDSAGRTDSLLASTTAGRGWGPHGNHKPNDSNRSLRNSPGGKLLFLSGDQTRYNWILR